MRRRQFLRTTTVTATTAAGASSLAAAPAHAAAPRKGPLRVHIVLFDGIEEQDFIAPYEVLSAAHMFSEDGVEVRYVRADGPGTVRCSYGTRVDVAHGWAPRSADLIVVAGGGYARRDGPGIWAEIDRGVLPRALAAAPRDGLTVASVCTGALLLSAAGLTRGRPCTTHHGAQEELAKQGGVVKQARVVDDGDLVTAGGITSGLDLGLWLARRELGADVALRLENLLEYEARGTVWA
ncbi:DJ-1/PfpI family protein [Streptomyces armeniacus]|uniref:DJ-1/PfpI family protein n=1 Tax=Streptomyces armeniacus TaxID=83291 RepID=A0A345XJ97_9ACTN|nr:DJ-1/PfpI family protein [Streptomyces armeniacus]AXK31713.1 DJ-1/PfpI family protein [Streptomyces armeniacus]